LSNSKGESVMPFKSQQQREMFWARAKKSKKWKKMAEEFESHTSKKTPLPNKVKKSRRK